MSDDNVGAHSLDPTGPGTDPIAWMLRSRNERILKLGRALRELPLEDPCGSCPHLDEPPAIPTFPNAD